MVIVLQINLIDVAAVIRSKNSGPYEITLDIIFKEQEFFDRVCAAKVFTPQKSPTSTGSTGAMC